LRDLQAKLKLSYLFISHDLRVIRYISDDILVMYKGKAVEYSSSKELFSNPKEDYTKRLLKAAGF
jgi:microcin C transport system ATP-binding protein